MLLESRYPATQSVEAIVELLKFLDKTFNPLPESVELDGMTLVLSNKRDIYYATTATSCSCPSVFYRPGQRCKHQRKYFPGQEKSQVEIRNEAEWAGGRNGPVNPDLFEQKKADQQDQEA